jgi:hypothetical protein
MKKTKKVELKVFEGRSKLKRGEITQIAESTWMSQGHVSNVLNGKRRDTTGEIFREAKTMVKGRRK